MNALKNVKNMSSVITNPIANIPVNSKSHTHGWAQVWSDQINAYIDHKCTANIKNASCVYIDHGPNFGGTLNLFGGATEEVYNHINIVMACDNIICLDWDMPDYGAMLKKRIGAKTTFSGITEEWCDRLSNRIKDIKSLKQENLQKESVTIGDSHTIAFSDKDDAVYRNDGKTLFGALKAGLNTLLRGTKPKTITWSLGSIDIRHHILRHKNSSLEDLIIEYVKQGDEITTQSFYSYPVPVEFEGRRIPKSGFYKGQAFYGSVQERKHITEQFIKLLKKHAGDRVISPPEEWYTMNPEMYANIYMEHGSSFHIAPPFYRRKKWGVTALVA